MALKKVKESSLDKNLKKTDGQAGLAAYNNSKCNSDWTTEKAGTRFRSFYNQWADTRKLYRDHSGTKLGIGADDIKKGITTIDQKLNAGCYGYVRMEKLFGERQNITHPILCSHLMVPPQ